MNRLTSEKILVGAALALAVGSFAWFGGPGASPGRSRRVAEAQPRPAFVPYAPAAEAPAGLASRMWHSPPAQARGTGWIYDVFTPPEIYYDARAGEFAIRPESSGTEARALAAPAGIELVAVKRALFPLQLLGFVGGEGHVMGSFENIRTGEVFLAGACRKLPALGLAITNFTVQRRPVPIADGTTSSQWVGRAGVRDERTGRLTLLTTGERAHTDEWVAVVALPSDGDEAWHELRLGEELQGAGQTYRVEALGSDPPLARIIATSPSSSPPRRLSLAPRPPRLAAAPASEE